VPVPGRPARPPQHGTISIVGSTTISDFTEMATRLYFWADWRARRTRASTTTGRSAPALTRICGHRRRCVKVSVRSSSMSLVPSARQSYDCRSSLTRSVAQMNIIMTQVFAAATNASSGVNTSACPCASGGAENFISGPLPITRCPKWPPVHRTDV